MNVTAVIVTYNGEEWIQRCLESVIYNCNVVVIDNCSSDGTVEIIKSNYHNVHLVESKENIGFGAANNIGIMYALEQQAEYVFLLNQDAWLNPGSLELLVLTNKENPIYGIISPIHLNGTGDMLDKEFGRYLYDLGGRRFITDKIRGLESHNIIDIDFVNAAAWLISEKCVKKIGLFDSLFFLYGEDDNYIKRARYHGFKIGVVDSSFICHDREGRDNKYFKNDFLLEVKNKKIKWSNVEIKKEVIQADIDKTIKARNISAYKQLLQFKFSSYKTIMNESKELKRIGVMGLESRQKNLSTWKG